MDIFAQVARDIHVILVIARQLLKMANVFLVADFLVGIVCIVLQVVAGTEELIKKTLQINGIKFFMLFFVF